MRRASAWFLFLATIGLLAPARAADAPAAAPAAGTPAAVEDATPAQPPEATATAAPRSRYGAAPGILLGVGVVLAGGGLTAALLDEEALGTTGACLGVALAVSGIALLVQPDEAPAAATAAAEEPAVRGVLAPAVGPDFVGLAGALSF